MRIGKYLIGAHVWKLDKGHVGLGFWFKNQLFYTHVWDLNIYLLVIDIHIYVMDMQELPKERF